MFENWYRWEKEEEELLKRENRSAQEREKTRYAHEKNQRKQRFEENVARTEHSTLPDEEKEYRINALQKRFDTENAAAEVQHRQKMEYLQNRDRDQLLADVKKRQEVVEEQFQKHKSLAQKALDLHVKMGWKYDWKYEKAIDWINEAPFEVIEKSHAMMQNGVSHEQIIAYALAKIAVGVGSEVTEKQLQAIQTLMEEERNLDRSRNPRYWNTISAIETFGKDVFLIAEKKKNVSLENLMHVKHEIQTHPCLLYTSPSPRD